MSFQSFFPHLFCTHMELFYALFLIVNSAVQCRHICLASAPLLQHPIMCACLWTIWKTFISHVYTFPDFISVYFRLFCTHMGYCYASFERCFLVIACTDADVFVCFCRCSFLLISPPLFGFTTIQFCSLDYFIFFRRCILFRLLLLYI